MRVAPDVGGLPAGPIDREPHERAEWECRVDALMQILARQRMLTVDEVRYAVERLGEKAYLEMSYYQRWIEALAQVMIDRGVVGVAELAHRIGEIEAGKTAD